MHLAPLICVRDVEASSRWYQELLRCESGHGGNNYERLNVDGRLILQLHDWKVEHDHGPLGDPAIPQGNGVLLWFELDDYAEAVQRAERMHVEITKPSHLSENGNFECWVRDPDGYRIVLTSPLHVTDSAPAANSLSTSAIVEGIQTPPCASKRWDSCNGLTPRDRTGAGMLSFELVDEGRTIQIYCDQVGMTALLDALAGLRRDTGHVHLRGPDAGGTALDSQSPFGTPAVAEVIIDYDPDYVPASDAPNDGIDVAR